MIPKIALRTGWFEDFIRKAGNQEGIADRGRG
jgi:hypothetical protein